MSIVHRAFVVALVVLAGVWIWETVALWRQTEADKIFYSQRVAPMLSSPERQSQALQLALRDRQQGKITPLPNLDPTNTASLDESLQRMKHRFEISSTRNMAQLGFMETAFAWLVVAQIQLFFRRRQSESPGRPAAPNAGFLVGDLIERGIVFEAREANGKIAQEVMVDGKRAVVAFRNFSFVAKFIGNPKQEAVELPFTDLLVGWITYDKGRAFLLLRTTRGKVTITDRVQPFQTLAETLLDAIELNRTSPEAYRAALAREPIVRTPWYGWLIIASAIAAVVVVGRWVFSD